jgi:ABC-type multidrug transport system permease subunit
LAKPHGNEQKGRKSPTISPNVLHSTHFVSFAQKILYRGAGFGVVWPHYVFVALVGGLFLALALLRFRSVAAQAT